MEKHKENLDLIDHEFSLQDESEMLKLSYMKSKDPNMPVIGMLTKFLSEEQMPKYENFTELLEPQYIRIFMGAKVIPISLNLSKIEIEKLLRQTNGLCIPGGHCNIYEIVDGKKVESLFTKVGRQVLEIAQKINDEGIYYPVFGVCLGFELFVAIIGKDIELVEKREKCVNYCAPLEFSEKSIVEKSKFYNCFTESQLQYLSKENLSFNYHSFATSIEKFQSNHYLSEFFNIIAVSPSSDNSFKFVTMIEGKKYPFYAVQHHPEWGVYNFYLTKHNFIVNSKTKEIMKSITKFLINETKKNKNRFLNLDDLEKVLVYNAKIVQNPIKGNMFVF